MADPNQSSTIAACGTVDAARERVEQHLGNSQPDITWYSPAQSYKLAARLIDGAHRRCIFANKADLLAFLIKTPDSIDGIRKAGATLEIANDRNASDGGFDIDDIADSLRDAARGKRKGQIVAATALSFFAVASVLAFYAIVWMRIK